MWIEVKVSQSCLTLCDPMDESLAGSSVHGTDQARILEWVAISSSRGFSLPRDGTPVSCTAGRFFTVWPTRLFYYRFVFSFPLYNTRSFSEFRQVLPADISSASLKSCLIATSIIFTPLIFLALWKGEYFKYLPWALQHLQDKLMTFSTLNLILRGNPCAHFSDSGFLISYEMYICPLFYISALHQPFASGHERDWMMCHFMKF